MDKKGLVIRSVSSFFYVVSEDDVIECRASKKLKLDKCQILTGDYVIYDPETNYINEIVERENQLIRPKIANVENSILVFSATEPNMNFGLLDRMILTMELNDLKTHILITKTDLLSAEQKNDLFDKLKYYEQIGYPVFDSNNDEDISKFKSLLALEKFVFTGQTGVGKSTFINKLLPNLELETQAISKALGRGKHTTREVNFYNYNDSYIIDTPGFSALEIPFSKEEIRDNYRDFVELATECRFSTCYHDQEPNCHVKSQVEVSKEVFKTRYENYIKLLHEIGEQR